MKMLKPFNSFIKEDIWRHFIEVPFHKTKDFIKFAKSNGVPIKFGDSDGVSFVSYFLKTEEDKIKARRLFEEFWNTITECGMGYEFDTAEEAEIGAISLGILGSHMIENGKYHPGATHGEFELALQTLIKKKKVNPVTEEVIVADKKDTITMDIPLLVRIMELSREDIKSDADLHIVVSNMLEMKSKTLTMDDYDKIAKIK